MTHTITLPGLIDCHVHFREPGYEHKGTFASEARAALAGGVHTVCEMPNTNPPTVSIAALEDKVRRTATITDVDIRFFFGITAKEHLREFVALQTEEQYRALKARCCGVKLYFDHSTGNQGATREILEEAFRVCSELGVVVVAHCEDPVINTAMKERVTLDDKFDASDPSSHSLLRPAESEWKATSDALELAARFGTHLHLAHLSTASSINLVRSAKNDHLPVTCEVAPHHLFLTVTDYETLNTFAKMNPPLRTLTDRDALWGALADGTIDCIATDHAPHTREEKMATDPLTAPAGVPGVETMLPLLLTVASGAWPHPSSPRPTTSFAHEDITRLCFENPNTIFHLSARSSPRITIDTEAQWTIRGTELHSKCGWTPYEGWKVCGSLKP